MFSYKNMKLKVVSSNIRFDNPGDGKHDWQSRREVLASVLNKFTPDILGTQEGWEPQLRDLDSLLPNLSISQDHREWITDRMYPSLFINTDRFSIIKSGDIWLSETPYVPASKSFNSAFPRLSTWATLKEKDTGKTIFTINAHLDHLETATRQEQVRVLLAELKTQNKDKSPILLLGDFNESPVGEVRNIIDESDVELIDPWLTLNKEETESHHGFKGYREDGARIDWILASKNFKIESIDLYKESTDGVYPSDHFPVFATFKEF